MLEADWDVGLGRAEVKLIRRVQNALFVLLKVLYKVIEVLHHVAGWKGHPDRYLAIEQDVPGVALLSKPDDGSLRFHLLGLQHLCNFPDLLLLELVLLEHLDPHLHEVNQITLLPVASVLFPLLEPTLNVLVQLVSLVGHRGLDGRSQVSQQS